jgi:hypothetical protein
MHVFDALLVKGKNFQRQMRTFLERIREGQLEKASARAQ